MQEADVETTTLAELGREPTDIRSIADFVDPDEQIDDIEPDRARTRFQTAPRFIASERQGVGIEHKKSGQRDGRAGVLESVQFKTILICRLEPF